MPHRFDIAAYPPNTHIYAREHINTREKCTKLSNTFIPATMKNWFTCMFSKDAGLWMPDEIGCPEVSELIDAFKGMTAVIYLANLTLGNGNVEAAHRSYRDALVLFTKLNNSRGVSWSYRLGIISPKVISPRMDKVIR